MNAKKMIVFILMQLSALSLMVSQPANADTLSELEATCPVCHGGVTVYPSGWQLDNGQRYGGERSIGGWIRLLDSMRATGGGPFPQDAAQFLYDKQYITLATTSPLTSVALTPTNLTININHRRQYAARGTFSNGEARYLPDGLPWNTKTEMSAGRMGAGVGVVNDILYTVGGSSVSGVVATVEAYDIANNTWSTKTSLPTARSGLGVGGVNGILYAVGGSSAGGAVATVEAYDPVANTWSVKAPLPAARTGLGVGVVDGILYAVGGNNAGGSVATVEAYNPITDTWTTQAAMPTARSALGVGVLNGLIYAVGGSNNSLDVTAVEAYNPANNSWASQTPLPTARSGLSVGVLYGILYAVGGVSNGAAVATVEAYDPATYAWTTQTPMLTARTGLGVGVGAGYGYLYALGGQKPDNSLAAAVEAYSPSVTWSSSDPSVATISSSGEVLGVSYGTTTITATSDNFSISTSLTVGNTPPTAWAGGDKTFNQNLAIKLWGSGSDADGRITSYQWTQTGGPTVAFTGADTAMLSFTTPSVTADTVLTFRLTVTDNSGATASNSANVTVKSVTQLPIANAGPDQTVNEGATVTLTGSGTDPYGTYLASHSWTRIAGPAVTLSSAGDAYGRQAKFTAPQVTADTVLTFQFSVQNQWGETGSDAVNVTVKPTPPPPPPTYPDLIVTAVSSGSVTSVMRGKTLYIDTITTNQGTAAASALPSAMVTGFYLSTDATITTADTLVGESYISYLAAGDRYLLGLPVTVPKKLARGTYYLGAIADYRGALAESNESNNSFTGTTIYVK